MVSFRDSDKTFTGIEGMEWHVSLLQNIVGNFTRSEFDVKLVMLRLQDQGKRNACGGWHMITDVSITILSKYAIGAVSGIRISYEGSPDHFTTRYLQELFAIYYHVPFTLIAHDENFTLLPQRMCCDESLRETEDLMILVQHRLNKDMHITCDVAIEFVHSSAQEIEQKNARSLAHRAAEFAFQENRGSLPFGDGTDFYKRVCRSAGRIAMD